MNKYEKACKEFLKGCSIAGPNSAGSKTNQEDCPECLKAFCDHIRNLKKQEDKNIEIMALWESLDEDIREHIEDINIIKNHVDKWNKHSPEGFKLKYPWDISERKNK